MPIDARATIDHFLDGKRAGSVVMNFGNLSTGLIAASEEEHAPT
jgi:hypothetical protein